MPKQKRLHQGKNYRQLQSKNSQQRSQLSPPQQKQLKIDGYRNVGWDNVIQLQQKLTEIALFDSVQDQTLEDLFIDVDRIGSKYQTPEEIAAFQKQLAEINQGIATEIDRQFPDEQAEAYDFSGR